MAPPCPEDAILSSVSWSDNRQAGTKKNYDNITFNKIERFSVEFGESFTGMVTVRIWVSGAGDKLEVIFDKAANGEGIQKVLSMKIL